MTRFKYIAVIAVTVCLIIIGFQFTGNEIISPLTKSKFSEYKHEMRKGDTTRKPSDWFTQSRAYPYDDVPFAEFKAAQDRAAQVYHASAGLDDFVCTFAGPSNVGGRITALAVHPDVPGLIYAGAALGGVLKSTDYGTSWEPISEDVPSLSVGDIAVHPDDPDILYLGTGEANSSGDSYAGTGLYRTETGGLEWQFVGLPESRHIARIVIDPVDHDRIFLAAMGSLFSTSTERGVYRSTDAGASWEQVLFVSDSTGAIDLVINPDNPDIIYAAMWERIRGPIDRRVGGLNSGIWRSTDGGDNWELLGNGLPGPSETNGRIGLAMSPVNSDLIYASYVNHPGELMGFWRTTDGGDTWQPRLQSPTPESFSGFGWYFGQIRAHPTQPNTVYALDVELWKSTDGGAHWGSIIGSQHVDFHALHIDPANPNMMISGNDGGVFISYNGGGLWNECYDLPITQFYAITIDKLHPERLYGGTQDNSTPRRMYDTVDDWNVIFYGDGFYTNVDFSNSNIVYAEAQYGYLGKSSNLGDDWNVIFSNYTHNERSNWNTPVVMSPHDPDILFYGAQRVWRTTNGGDSWDAISDDLTNGPGNGNLLFGTITTIDQSALNGNIIWAGTDDSNVWLTTDGGFSWEEVSDSLPERWCTRVTADVFDEGTAYCTFSGYKVDDLMPHIFKTNDYGASWTDISGNLEGVPVNDILPDPQIPGRLYIGTDFGLFYSNDSGATWEGMSTDHPIVPVFDIDLHSDARILVSGTHGRSMYQLDLTTVGIEEQNTTPSDYSLSQNYPNPFNASTTIPFTTEKQERIRINVYDVNGRLIRNITDKVYQPGSYTIRFDGENLASGTYFAAMQTSDGKYTKKMVLLK